MAAILGAYISALARHLPAMSRTQIQALAEPSRLLLEACAASGAEPGGDDTATPATILERARRTVREHIGVTDFGPTQLCRAMGMSRSKLYRMFERTGGVAAFIQRERLRVAFERLSSPVDGPISAIAAEVGFLDHSTFSRAFRREFGVSPSDIRNATLCRPISCAADPGPHAAGR